MDAVEAGAPRVLYIVGAGHCGSTLLSLLLNGHPACLALSELAKLRESLTNHDPVLEAPAWLATRHAFEARTGRRFEDLDLAHPSWKQCAVASREAAARWAEPRHALLQSLAETTGRTWIVDASKSWQSLYMMERSRRFDLRVVHLVRDGHGVVHSYATKYGDLTHGLARWIKPSVAAIPLAAKFDHRWLRLRYEDLASDPQGSLEQICALLGLTFNPAMMRFRSHPWLGIGGNRMSRRDDEQIRLDEKWRREMSPRHRRIVDLVGWPLNRYFGY